MSDDRHERIKELLNAALSREPAERNSFLSEACAGDAALEVEVASLIAAHEGGPGLLEKPRRRAPRERPAQDGVDSDDLEAESHVPFDLLGEFRLIRRLAKLAEELLPPTPRRLWGARDLAWEALRIGLKRHRDGPVLEQVSEAVDLTRLPALTTWPP